MRIQDLLNKVKSLWVGNVNRKCNKRDLVSNEITEVNEQFEIGHLVISYINTYSLSSFNLLWDPHVILLVLIVSISPFSRLLLLEVHVCKKNLHFHYGF